MKSIDKQFYSSLGQKIKQAREKKGYSLQEVKDKVDLLIEIYNKNKPENEQRKPIVRQSLWKMEEGLLRIDNDVYYDLCQVLDIDPDEIFNSNQHNLNVDEEYEKLYNQVFNNPDLKILFDKTKELTKEDLKFVISLVEKIKKEHDENN